jgi:hypothetical protein
VYQRQDTTSSLGTPPGFNYLELSVGRKLFDFDAGFSRPQVYADLGWSRTRSASDEGTPVYDRAVLGMVTLTAGF